MLFLLLFCEKYAHIPLLPNTPAMAVTIATMIVSNFNHPFSAVLFTSWSTPVDVSPLATPTDIAVNKSLAG